MKRPLLASLLLLIVIPLLPQAPPPSEPPTPRLAVHRVEPGPSDAGVLESVTSNLLLERVPRVRHHHAPAPQRVRPVRPVAHAAPHLPSTESYPTASAAPPRLPAAEVPAPAPDEAPGDVGVSAALDGGLGTEPRIAYLLVEAAPANATEKAEAPPLHLAIVLDVSGSMDQEMKLTSALAATHDALSGLRPVDRGTLTLFPASAQTVTALPGVDLRKLVRSTHLVPGTRMGTGLREALAQLERTHQDGANDHVLLLTDGETDDAKECETLADGAARDNVAISTIGLGHDCNKRLLAELAALTGGSAHLGVWSDTLAAIFRDEVARARHPVWHGCQLELRLAQGVSVRRAFEMRPRPRDFGSLTGEDGVIAMPLGNLPGDSRPCALFELQLPPGRAGQSLLLRSGFRHDGKVVEHQLRVAYGSQGSDARVTRATDEMARLFPGR